MNFRVTGEDAEQRAVIEWANWNMNQHPELRWLYHCPNGGSRNGIEATKLKMMGVKPGVSDLCLPYPRGAYVGLFIEMKYDKGKPSAYQKEFLKDMAEAGHFVCICYTALAAEDIIEEYLNLEKNEKMREANNCTIK